MDNKWNSSVKVEKDKQKIEKINKLKVLYTNIRSVLSQGKLDEIKCYVEEEKIDVVGLTETWLQEDVLDSEIGIPGFRLFRRDRKSIEKKRGG